MSNECRDELIEEAEQLLREALLNYLAVSCKRISTMLRLSEQPFLKLEFYGLFRYYTSSENFPRFMDAYSYVKRCRGLERVAEVLGCERIVENDEDERLSQLVFSTEKILEICSSIEQGEEP